MLKAATVIGSLVAGSTAVGLVHLQSEPAPVGVLEPMVEKVRPDNIVLTKRVDLEPLFVSGLLEQLQPSEQQKPKRLAYRSQSVLPSLMPCSDWRSLGPKALTRKADDGQHRVRRLCR
jgi:hypothetical protein